MIKNRNYLDIKEILKDIPVPRDKNLILLKIKELFQIDSSDINIETINNEDIYFIRYKEVQVSLKIDYYNQRFILSPNFDVYDETDNIVESY